MKKKYQLYKPQGVKENLRVIIVVLTILRSISVTSQSIPTVLQASSTVTISTDEISESIANLNSFLSSVNPCDPNYVGYPSQIQLCLAQRNINGQLSNGVNILSPTFSQFNSCEDEFALKISARMFEDLYPPTDYLNIYLVDEICAPCESFGCSAGGFARLPHEHGSTLDGIVLEVETFLGDCDDSKIVLHELGHYLGLYHTFEGGCKNDNCLEDGDKVCDTPPQRLQVITNNHKCLRDSVDNTCSTDVNALDIHNTFATDQADPDDNIMNYVPLSCQTRLTEGQIQRMQSILADDRRSLLRSNGCLAPCSNPQPILLEVPQIAFVDQEITLSSNSLLNSLWEVEGQILNEVELEYTFELPGSYPIRFYTDDDEPGCNQDTSFVIIVECFESIEIETSSNTIEEGDVITFEVTNPNSSVVYDWYIKNNLIGTGESISITTSGEGAQSIVAVGSIDDCFQQSNIWHYVVGKCPVESDGSIWIFGIEGLKLNFETGAPIEEPKVGGSNFNEFSAGEACSIQLDSDGDILFYSDNTNVYTRNDTLMSNGFFLGEGSATQTVTVKQPGSSNLYYIFTPQNLGLNLQNDSTKTILYSVIDMNADGGLGEVTIKKERLLEYGFEKVTAIKHCNGYDWWIVTHEAGTNRFLSFLLSDTGLDLTPSISSFGKVHEFLTSDAMFIKFSHDGKYVATTGSESQVSLEGDFLEVFRFDNSRGTVTELVLSDTTISQAFGIEFSANNGILYCSDFANHIYQYDLSLNNKDSILASRVDVFDNVNSISAPLVGSLQLGIDEKIYVGYNIFPESDSALHVINKPNVLGLGCDFQYAGLKLAYGEPFIGLPSFPARAFRDNFPEIEGPSKINLCSDSIGVYYSFGRCSVEDYTWTLLGKNELLHAVGDTTSIRFIEESFDTLLLSRTTACDVYTDSLIINIKGCPEPCDLAFDWLKVDTLICLGEDPTLQFSSNADEVYIDGVLLAPYKTHIILDNVISDSSLTIRLRSDTDCDSTFQLNIEVAPELALQYQDSYDICLGQEVSLSYQTDADVVELWNENTDTIYFPDNNQLMFTPDLTDQNLLLRLARFEGNCDSYFPVTIIIDTMTRREDQNFMICQGDSLSINDSLILSEGTFLFDLETSDGCDSLYVVAVDFFQLPTPDTTYQQVCTELEVDTSFIEMTSDNNCIYQDVIITQLIEIDTTYSFDTVCNVLDTSTSLISLPDVNGCDSIVQIQSVFLLDSMSYIGAVDTQICKGSTIIIDDLLLSDTGSYFIETEAANGCDSLVQLHLKYYPEPNADTIYLSSCDLLSNDTIVKVVTDDNGCTYDQITINEAKFSTITLDTVSTCDAEMETDSITLTDQFGCDSLIAVTVIPVDFEFELSIDTVIDLGNSINANLILSNPDLSSYWYYDDELICTDCVTLNYNPMSSAVLKIILESNEGCIKEVEVWIEVIIGIDNLQLPNIFSPNGDGINDRFNPSDNLLTEIKTLDIYDKWGNRVFSESDRSPNEDIKGWDGTFEGKNCLPGVYVFSVKISEDGIIRTFYGTITIIR